MNLQSTINHLEASLLSEIQSKQQAIDWIDSLEQAVRAGDSADFERLVAEGAGLCKDGDASSRRRKSLMIDLGNHWGVAPQALTLGGVIRRLKVGGEQLGRLRSELRSAIAHTMKRQRRLAALIGMHRRLNADVMQIILGCESPEEVQRGGSLINAEA